eukprot:Hpha_TRINITY_DN5009_c0_g1::TRINITY_DN5009_c0_g1_i2::g.94119::m.94119
MAIGSAAAEGGTWSDEESEEEEEEKAESDVESLVELDYAAEMRRRAREEEVFQDRKGREPSPPPDRGVAKGGFRQTWTSRADPFDMMPRRYTDAFLAAPSYDPTLGGVVAVALAGIAAARGSRRLLRRALAESEGADLDQQRRSRLEAMSRDLDARTELPANGHAHPEPQAAAAAAATAYDGEAAAALEAADLDFNPGTLCRLLEEEVRGDIGDWRGSADAKFDQAQQILERMVTRDKGFRQVQRKFLREHCYAFSPGENKLECWPIFRRWEALMEECVHQRLQREIPGFEMEAFLEILADRGEEVSGDVWELLLSLTNFGAFKQRMLSEQERARAGLDDSSGSEDLEEYMEEARRITRAARRRVKRQQGEELEQHRRVKRQQGEELEQHRR